jgi:pimeloyl-ACP methyl ester carboxylesterase
MAPAPASQADVRDERANFRALFCREPGDDTAHTRESCRLALREFRDEGLPTRQLTPSPPQRADYRVAVALGVGWDCMREIIDEDALPTALLKASGYDTTLVDVEGLSSSERNAQIIAERLLADPDDQRPFILVGYSKGTADFLVALATYPELARRTAALVTVAGSVGGSPVAEHTSRRTTDLLYYSPFGDCAHGDGLVMDSLRPPLRHAWLQDHLPLPMPTYSLVTAPEPHRVSRVLHSSYKLLGTVHPINDGALLAWDQVLPGSTLLGYANADHWAVAVPIAVDDIPLGDILVTNGYPRTRLWRTILDFVIADLNTPEADSTAAGE